MPDKAPNGEAVVVVGGARVPSQDVVMWEVSKDAKQPNMTVITLRNHHHAYSTKHKLGDAVEVTVHGETVFRGEVVGLEPVYRGAGANTVVLRAFDRLHRLTRSRAGHTYHGPGYFLKIEGISNEPGNNKGK